MDPPPKLVEVDRIELSPGRLSADCSPGELHLCGAPCQIRTGFSGLQVRRIARNAYRARDSGANGANRTLIGCLPCNCSPIELHRLEPEGIFETPTSALRVRRSISRAHNVTISACAPALKLLRHGASAENRTSLIGQAIRCPANRPRPRTMERTEIIEISSLGWRPKAHPIYHARLLHTYCRAHSVVKELRSNTPVAPRLHRETS